MGCWCNLSGARIRDLFLGLLGNVYEIGYRVILLSLSVKIKQTFLVY